MDIRYPPDALGIFLECFTRPRKGHEPSRRLASCKANGTKKNNKPMRRSIKQS